MKDRQLSRYFLSVADDAMRSRMWRRTAERITLAERVKKPLRLLAFGVLLVAAVCTAYTAARLRARNGAVHGHRLSELLVTRATEDADSRWS